MVGVGVSGISLRRRSHAALAGAVLLTALLSTAAAVFVLDRAVGAGVHALATGTPSADAVVGLELERRAARWVLVMAAGASALIALGVAVAGLHLWVVSPLERTVRAAAADPALPRPTGDEVQWLAEALQTYRRALQAEQVGAASRLEAARGLVEDGEVARVHLELSDRLALVGRVGMGIAHEVGSPLALLQGSIEHLRNLDAAGAPVAAHVACLDQMDAAVARIGTMLQDLSEPGLVRTRGEDQPCDALAVASRVEEVALRHPRARTLDLGVDATGDPHLADVSASHLEQVLLNLILNAADATQRAGQVRLRLSREGAFVCVHVDDDGPGVPAALRERVFEELFTTKSGGPGTAAQAGWGLGLAVSRRTIEAYGGTLHVGEAPGLGGARFTVRVPGSAAQRLQRRGGLPG
ncbi:MAG: HAMP domain-containing histidine kinase [Myxococcales bacterium]|nr:HAMP domain-containing histidine kinase [Myxococcales bacterium]